ncbi:ATP-binding protein [Methanolacinia paynteri]|uniref:ATP-binding protein n=1 Tax=Methanolacinia paynteri TaxID=230356 RepID=UPI00064F9420|nr:ATP-binding protein [Methanolacinia paynteri]
MNLQDIETNDYSKYRLVGNSVLSYRFTVPHNEMIFVGDILKITDSEKDLVFFAKITDLLHDSNFADSKWDTRPHTNHFYNLGEDVYITAEATPLGCIDKSIGSEGTFRKARTIPTKFSEVSKPDDEDFRFLKSVMGDIEVGMMRTGQEVLKDVPVSLHSSILPQHMGVFATTGMGKSNFMKTFCASCMKERKFGLLMVDPHGEYVAGGRSSTGDKVTGLLNYSNGRDGLTVFTISDLNIKRYSLNRLTLSYDDFRASDLFLLYEHSQAQRELVEILDDLDGGNLIDFFMNTDFSEFDPQVPETYTGPHTHMASRVRNFSPSTLEVIQRRVVSLVSRNSKFLKQRTSAIDEIVTALHNRKVVLIDIPGMNEQSELLVLSIITRKLLRIHQNEEKFTDTGSDDIENVLITIEEAQRVLGSGAGKTQIFRECAMEGRKFGIGLCVITQQPKNIDPKVLAQLNTFVIMGLGDRNDRQIVSASAKQDLSEMDTEIQTLDTGEAIISSPKIPFPVSTKIHKFETYVASLNKKTPKSPTPEKIGF